MVIKNVNLEIVCGITSKIPDTAYNEVAFAGKSNVGKSSLINATDEPEMPGENLFASPARPRPSTFIM